MLNLLVMRGQKKVGIEIKEYAYVVTEVSGSNEFKTIPLASESAVVPAKATAGGAKTNNDPIESLVDGKITDGFGPVFANGDHGMYKLDLAVTTAISQVNTFSRGGERGRQNFVLYGSNAPTDPGWNVAERKLFTPIIAVDARQDADYKATSIRFSDGQPLGSFRWLVWAVFPVNDMENTAFQELQVIPAKVGSK